jgi:tetratricopeptide (TPR) repeat protein
MSQVCKQVRLYSSPPHKITLIYNVIYRAELAIGMAYLELHNSKEALVHLNKDLEFCRGNRIGLKKQDSYSLKDALINEGQAHQNIGLAYHKSGDYESALQSYDNGLQCYKQAKDSKSHVNDIKVNIESTKEAKRLEENIRLVENENLQILCDNLPDSTPLEKWRKRMNLLDKIKSMYADIGIPREREGRIHVLLIACTVKLCDNGLEAQSRLDYAEFLYKLYCSSENERKLQECVFHSKLAASLFASDDAGLSTCYNLIGNALSAG